MGGGEVVQVSRLLQLLPNPSEHRSTARTPDPKKHDKALLLIHKNLYPRIVAGTIEETLTAARGK